MVGDQIAVLPVLFRLLWRQVLVADLENVLLSANTQVRPGWQRKGAGMPLRPRLLRAGDVVRFDGRLHTVAALEGTAVRLVDEAQSASVVMLAHLLSGEGFEVITAASVRTAVPSAGVLEGLSDKAVERAEWWQRHLVELLTGRPSEDPHGPVRAEYDPAVRSLRQRELAKIAELSAAGTAVSLTVVQDMRARFEREGVLGLVDPRLRSAPDGTGRVDRRVAEALRKIVDGQTGRSTVSAQVLRRRMERLLEAEHGPGVVPLPSRATFYRLFKAVSSGGRARRRRSWPRALHPPLGRRGPRGRHDPRRLPRLRLPDRPARLARRLGQRRTPRPRRLRPHPRAQHGRRCPRLGPPPQPITGGQARSTSGRDRNPWVAPPHRR